MTEIRTRVWDKDFNCIYDSAIDGEDRPNLFDRLNAGEMVYRTDDCGPNREMYRASTWGKYGGVDWTPEFEYLKAFEMPGNALLA